MFNQELKFEKHLISLECDDSAEEKIIAVNTLEEILCQMDQNCDTCQYLKKRWQQAKTYKTKLKILHKTSCQRYIHSNIICRDVFDILEATDLKNNFSFIIHCNI